MVRNPARKNKLRSTLIVIIFATIPCYLLGMVVLWVGNSVKNQQNITPTVTLTATIGLWGGTPSSTLPPIPTNPSLATATPTLTTPPTATITYVIPSNTPTLSPTPTFTATATITAAVTDTPAITDTPTVTETTVTP